MNRFGKFLPGSERIYVLKRSIHEHAGADRLSYVTCRHKVSTLALGLFFFGQMHRSRWLDRSANKQHSCCRHKSIELSLHWKPSFASQGAYG